MYKIFVITHKDIFEYMYKNENISNYVFVNVSENILDEHLYQNYNVLDIKNDKFIPLGKWYTESEVIYNIYKNKMYENLTHIGFLHYDVEPNNLSNFIEQNIFEKCHINMQPFEFNWDYNQHIMADDTQTETLVGDGRNCYELIFQKYNEYYNTNKTYNDMGSIINLCSCFFIDVVRFEKMMEWIVWVIESKELDKYDNLHRHRLQGGLLERFYAVWLSLNYDKCDKIDLYHNISLK